MRVTKLPEELEGPPIDKPAERLKQFRDARRPPDSAEDADPETRPQDREDEVTEGGSSDEKSD